MQINTTSDSSIKTTDRTKKATTSGKSLRTTEKQIDLFRVGIGRMGWPCRHNCSQQFATRAQRNGHEGSCMDQPGDDDVDPREQADLSAFATEGSR